ncbi:MAG TPA: flagellar basal-body rod protein FlgG [Symbiobacteriaceae bacterium]|nr:flagellar basal-body rod protein FlgG [Symbiobacteriaceae bacterium]
MLRALYTAASGMAAQQMNMDTVSHNLANVNTTGFAKGRVEFQDLLYTQMQSPLRNQPVGIAVGHGVRLSSTQRIFGGGALQVTGNDYDVAIQGNGFFRVQRADGSFGYTRDGSFHLDAQRRLVTAQGDLVMGSRGPITIPAEAASVQIGADGTIQYAKTTTAQDGKQTEATAVLDRISLAVFANPSGLEAQGDNLFVETVASGQPALRNPGDQEAGRVVQGHLEGSNVQSVEEMVNLIVAQRAYEINSKVVQSADEMMQLANQLRRG